MEDIAPSDLKTILHFKQANLYYLRRRVLFATNQNAAKVFEPCTKSDYVG